MTFYLFSFLCHDIFHAAILLKIILYFIFD